MFKSVYYKSISKTIYIYRQAKLENNKKSLRKRNKLRRKSKIIKNIFNKATF